MCIGVLLVIWGFEWLGTEELPAGSKRGGSRMIRAAATTTVAERSPAKAIRSRWAFRRAASRLVIRRSWVARWRGWLGATGGPHRGERRSPLEGCGAFSGEPERISRLRT